MSISTWLMLLMIAVVVIAVLVFEVAIEDIPHRRRMRAVARNRSAVFFSEFISYFTDKDIEPAITRLVYQAVQKELARIKCFPVRATDDLRQVYGVDEELLAAVIEDILSDGGRRFPSNEEGCCTSLEELRTVEDVVGYVASCPKAADVRRQLFLPFSDN